MTALLIAAAGVGFTAAAWLERREARRIQESIDAWRRILDDRYPSDRSGE